ILLTSLLALSWGGTPLVGALAAGNTAKPSTIIAPTDHHPIRGDIGDIHTGSNCEQPTSCHTITSLCQFQCAGTVPLLQISDIQFSNKPLTFNWEEQRYHLPPPLIGSHFRPPTQVI
ncbi:MAG: hypothetical protein MI754_11680, partial [Chromatiales bacterium]|nr:hypothetical protein [Chromatiales bacterium]